MAAPVKKPEFTGQKNPNFRISNRFKGILKMEMIGSELIVVENVWKNLLKKMEEPLKVSKFGN